MIGREINLIVVHCAATPPSMDIGANEIRDWHTEKGWSDIGYHNVIRRNGALEHGRDLAIPGAHAKGFNKHSLGICLIGGVNEDNEPEDNFTDAQMVTLRGYLDTMSEVFDIEIKGHRDLPNVNKACPSFYVGKWY